MRLPRLRLTMRLTVRRTMIAVACLGLMMAGFRWLFTTYFVARYAGGYSESGFDRLRVGMTPIQVEAIVGVPLRKFDRPQGDGGSWIYVDSAFSMWCEKRRVLFKGGKVRAVVKQHWQGELTILE